ncbi:dUTP diphosphatase [Oceanobacillus luteolus]|uniref:dUTP diphosphatase n=1 Tax=Oceanobacillus luteolus TaxID=1274358 RepID=A0ABW4HR82_9BACI|nr:dUTP diphosphatase [Oceanobacillus luteolus]MCM3739899.1 dUTP diphosphatase [Oceanobacillus luteolus]
MNWEKLYSMQKELDTYILENHDLRDRDLFNEKYLAFLVELGELANETRCFKYWSTKKSSERQEILAEYVDGIHFLLSIGLDTGYQIKQLDSKGKENTATEQFNEVFSIGALFKQQPTFQNYENLFEEYINLGEVLGFTKREVYEAYVKKNEINFERQDKGY